MDAIPTELLERILTLLPLCDQIRLEIVCKQWRKILSSFWQLHDRSALHLKGHDLLIKDGPNSCLSVPITINADLTRIMKGVFGRCGDRIKSIDFEQSTCVDISILSLVGQRCNNLETLRLCHLMSMDYHASESSASLAPLVSLPKLASLALISNVAVQENENGWSSCRKWSLGPVCPAVQLFPAGLDQISSNLVALHLEDIVIASRVFLSLCERLGPHLEQFCLKLSECTMRLQAAREGLSMLRRLRSLNLSCPGRAPQKKNLAAMLDDDFLENIVRNMPRLERLALRGAMKITSFGVNQVLTSYCGLHCLQYLNLNWCRLVDHSIGDGVKWRSDRNPEFKLVIYAYITAIDDRWSSLLSGESLQCKVIVKQENMDEAVFFGQNNLNETKSYPSDGDGENSEVTSGSSDEDDD